MATDFQAAEDLAIAIQADLRERRVNLKRANAATGETRDRLLRLANVCAHDAGVKAARLSTILAGMA